MARAAKTAISVLFFSLFAHADHGDSVRPTCKHGPCCKRVPAKLALSLVAGENRRLFFLNLKRVERKEMPRKKERGSGKGSTTRPWPLALLTPLSDLLMQPGPCFALFCFCCEGGGVCRRRRWGILVMALSFQMLQATKLDEMSTATKRVCFIWCVPCRTHSIVPS